jgi:APA family basic amino acid/polyamine antiporter
VPHLRAASEITAVLTVAGILAVWLMPGTTSQARWCAELASTFRTGVYVTREGGPAGFWAGRCSGAYRIIAAIAVVFARYAGHSSSSVRPVQAVAIASFSRLSSTTWGKAGEPAQTGFTVCRWPAIIVLQLVLGGRVSGSPSRPPRLRSPRRISSPVRAGLFAFGGWHMVTYSAEETVSP